MSTATISIGADISGFRQGLSQATGQMKSFATSVASVASGQALFAGLQAGIGAVGSAFTALGTTFRDSISVAGEFEAVVAQFTTFYKSAETAQGAVAELAKYSATTSFQLGEVANAGAGLAAAGVPAEQLKESIRVIGDIAAGTKRPLAEILQPYVKALSVGKLQTETFQQFLERGIPIGEALKKALNLDDAGLQKSLTAGAISAQDMVNALQEMTTTGLFSGAAAAQGQTLNGLLSTLADNVEEVKRNLGLAASSGLKPLIEFAQGLVGKFAPLGTSLGNIFTAATQKALQFSDDFSAGFGRAIDTAVKAFQIIEGAIQNGTLWDVLSTAGKLAFLEITEAGIRALQGIADVFSEADAFTGLTGALVSAITDALGTASGSVASTLGTALVDTAKAWLDYVMSGIKQIPAALGELFSALFQRGDTAGLGKRTLQGMGAGAIPFQTSQSFFAPQTSGMTSAQAQEMMAAKAAGYPTPLTPGEVRETFAAGRRITYNTKETVANGIITPPSNADAFAEGTPGQGIIAAFERGFGRQTTATEKLQTQNEKLRVELQRLTEAALKNATAIREQSSTLKNQTELTAKTTQAEAQKSAAVRTGDQFTSLQKIGGGIRRVNLAARPAAEGGDFLAATLRPAGGLGGGFAASKRFLEAQAQARNVANIPIMGPMQGPPAPPPVSTPERAAQVIAEGPTTTELLNRLPRRPSSELGFGLPKDGATLEKILEAIRSQGSLNVQAT
jgi:tape measure domain-containing protein